jgi:SAM-dependent methyltransferase
VQHEDRQRAGSFGEDANQYDRARPAYPADLVDDLLRDRPRLILDVGCGTGIASRLLAARGCQVVGVEPDSRMAAVARGHGLAVEGATFEDWDPDGRRFDLIVSAQAWHWVDPVRGASKAGEILRPGGRIGVFWNRAQLPETLRPALTAAYQRVAPSLGEGYALPSPARTTPDESCRTAAAAFEDDGRFSDVSMAVFTHSVEYTTAEWLDLLPTHSDHRLLPSAQLAEVLETVGRVVDSAGGRFDVRYHTWLAGARAG